MYSAHEAGAEAVGDAVGDVGEAVGVAVGDVGDRVDVGAIEVGDEVEPIASRKAFIVVLKSSAL